MKYSTICEKRKMLIFRQKVPVARSLFFDKFRGVTGTFLAPFFIHLVGRRIVFGAAGSLQGSGEILARRNQAIVRR